MLKLGGDLERASGVTGKIQLPDVHGGFKGVHFFSFFFLAALRSLWLAGS